MTRTYTRTVCEICGKEHSTNGLAATRHARWHVKQGDLTEGFIYYGKYKSPRFEYTKQGSDKARLRRQAHPAPARDAAATAAGE